MSSAGPIPARERRGRWHEPDACGSPRGWSAARRQSRSTRCLVRAVPEAITPRARVAAGLLPGVARGDLAAGRGALPGQTLDPTHDRRVVAAGPAAGLDPAKIAPGSAVALHLVSQLVPCHRCEQLEQLLGRLQLVLPQGGADEEAGQHRLADVHRVEQPVQPGVHQPDARSPADRWLVPTHQLRCRLPVPGPNATEQHLEAFIPRARIPHRCRDLRFPTRSSRSAEPDGTFTSDYGDHRPCRTDPILTPHPLDPPPLRRGCLKKITPAVSGRPRDDDNPAKGQSRTVTADARDEPHEFQPKN